MSQYPPHVYVIPEDDRDRQIADGFVLHDQVDDRRIRIVPPAGGWRNVLQTFVDEYVTLLSANPNDHVVMLIDFDGNYDSRLAEFGQRIPEALKARVFVIGPEQTPEKLKKDMSKSYEEIGLALAHDCYAGTEIAWGHEQIKHNDPDRQRLLETVKPFLFK